VHLAADIGCPVLSRAMGSIMHRHSVGYLWRVNLGETAARSKWDAAADWRSNGRLDSFRVQGISDCRCLRILIDARVLPC